MNPFTWASDRIRDLLNPGEAELNVPPLEGPLKPNDLIDGARLVAALPDADNLVVHGDTVHVTSGPGLYRLASGQPVPVRTFAHPITALLALSDGGLAVALDGHGVHFVGGTLEGAELREVNGRPLLSVTDLAEVDGALVLTEGSTRHRAADWLRDLMGKHRAGRILRFDLATRKTTVLAEGLGWPAGLCALPSGREVLVSLAWEHRLVRLPLEPRARPQTLWRNMVGYAGRPRPAEGGGYWLPLFAMRTKLVEFVLQEDEYRRLMMEQIEPKYWVAPALAALDDHWEPLQGGGIKQLGIVKPWAPPRSYGLIARLDAAAEPVGSLHSRAGQRRHGITSVVESAGSILFTSKGNGLVLEASSDITTRRAA